MKDRALDDWVSPFAIRGREPAPLELGLFPGCGFRLFLRPYRPCTDRDLLMTMNLDPIVPLAPASPLDTFVMSIANLGNWTHLADDYGLWNDARRRRTAVDALAQLGDLLTFLLPDPDMSYAFALYRGGVRVRLRVVDSPRFDDQVLRVEKGRLLVGEPAEWRGEPFPMMISIARGLGVAMDGATRQRFYGWGDRGIVRAR